MATRALLFDLDGTLCDSWPWYARLIGRDDGAKRAAVAQALRDGKPFARLLDAAGVTKARFRAACAEGGCELYPGVRETLEALRERGTIQGVVTNLPQWIAHPMLDGVGIAEFFGAVSHYSTAPRCKPHPAPILAALDELGVAPTPEIYYVGDTHLDAQASAAAGISFAWASYGYGDRIASVPRIINEFPEVIEL